MRRFEHGGNVYTRPGIRFDFSVNTNPAGLPPQVREALAANMDRFVRYPDPDCGELRRALAVHHGCGAERILCGNGAADLIFRLCACVRPRKALVPSPTFSEYERSVRLFGGELAEVPLSREEAFALPESFPDQIGPDVDLVFLCTPNNPTGVLTSPALIRRTAERCRQVGALLLVDECFLPFTGGPSVLPLLKEYPNLIILRAFTKLYAMAGLRLGYLLGDPGLLERIAPFGPHWAVSVPAQTAGVAALSAEPEWTQRTQAFTRGERDFLSRGLSRMGVTVFPSAANFLLLESETPLHRPLLERGILVRDCSNFTGLDDRHIRVAVRSREESLALLSAIEEVLHG